MPLAAEYELLRQAVVHRSGECAVSASRLNVDWNVVLWLGRREDALLFLHEAMSHGALPAACPDEIRGQLDDLNAVAKLQALDRTAVVCRLSDALAREGIPFFLADDWMFQSCFHPERTLIETKAAIRCLVRASDQGRAQAALSAAGLPSATAQCQVAARQQTPVECLTTLAAGEDIDALFSSAAGNATHLTVAGRSLRRLGAEVWLRHLATPWAGRRRISLLSAWQIARLAELTGPQPVSVEQVVAASRAILNPAGNGSEFYQAETFPPASSPAPVSFFPAPFVPTPAPVVERMLALAQVQASDVVFDLGCGEGSIVIEAASRFGARAIGIDCDPGLLATAAARAASAGVADRVTFERGDLFSADVRAATVICLYLAPALYAPVRERVLRSAKPGTRIVSCDYFFPAWPPSRAALVRAGPASISQIYLWQVPWGVCRAN